MNATKTWNEASVKSELPRVWVRQPNGRVVSGRVTGRCNPFATVYIGSMDDTRSAEFSWSTIAHCLNADRPLRF